MYPDYVVEPPDILRIDVIRASLLPTYKFEPSDVLSVAIVFPDPKQEPFVGNFTIEPSGVVNLGPSAGGLVPVAGKTFDEVKKAVEEAAKSAGIKDPRVQVSLVQARRLQDVRGEHIVKMDGTVRLGTYGSVRVVGLTLNEAKAAIEAHLGQFLQSPEVSVDVAAYNSKVYFVIYDGAGRGELVYQLPCTGNDTVLSAVAQLNGLTAVSSKHHIWVARPTPAFCGQENVLPVDWVGISKFGKTETNYQLFPGDRLYVRGNALIAADNRLAQFLAPIERILGVTLLGGTAVNSIQTVAGFGRNGQTTTVTTTTGR